jgi:probable rRNA maturation factor
MPRRLHLTFHAFVGASAVPYLRRHIRKAHQLLAPPLREFSIALVNDQRMSDLHMQFMNIAGPTDVLTFPLELNDDGMATAGEVILCVPEARRRAKEHGVTVENELLLYALHGMLHLSGFDDRTARGFARMHRTEDEILQRLGVGPVFHARREQPARVKHGGRR